MQAELRAEDVRALITAIRDRAMRAAAPNATSDDVNRAMEAMCAFDNFLRRVAAMFRSACAALERESLGYCAEFAASPESKVGCNVYGPGNPAWYSVVNRAERMLSLAEESMLPLYSTLVYGTIWRQKMIIRSAGAPLGRVEAALGKDTFYVIYDFFDVKRRAVYQFYVLTPELRSHVSAEDVPARAEDAARKYMNWLIEVIVGNESAIAEAINSVAPEAVVIGIENSKLIVAVDTVSGLERTLRGVIYEFLGDLAEGASRAMTRYA